MSAISFIQSLACAGSGRAVNLKNHVPLLRESILFMRQGCEFMRSCALRVQEAVFEKQKRCYGYPINLFEIAFLPDEVVSAFKSDFRFVADYFVQMRKTGTYMGSNEEMVHVREVTQLLAVLTKDIRFAEVVKEAENEGKEIKTMCKVLDEIEERGIRKGIEKGIEQGIEQELEHIVEVLLRKGKKIADISELCEIPAETIRRINNKLLQKA